MDRREPDCGARYVYGVVRPGTAAAERLAGVPGVAGQPVRLVETDRLAAAVSDVPAEEYSEESLKLRLEDLDWVEATARAHHAVIEALGSGGAVLPLRLATVYHSDERVRDLLREREEEFGALLTRLAGHLEWGVKIYALPDAPAPAPVGATAGAASGRDYLRQRRAAREHREDAWLAAARVGERIDRELAGLVADTRRYRPQEGRLAELSALPGVNVANVAYLVSEADADRFRALVQEIAAEDPRVRVDVTGPWAPYSFASGAS